MAQRSASIQHIAKLFQHSLHLEVGTTEQNPYKHASRIKQMRFDDNLEVAFACICLLYQPTVQASKELRNSVNTVAHILDVMCYPFSITCI